MSFLTTNSNPATNEALNGKTIPRLNQKTKIPTNIIRLFLIEYAKALQEQILSGKSLIYKGYFKIRVNKYGNASFVMDYKNSETNGQAKNLPSTLIVKGGIPSPHKVFQLSHGRIVYGKAQAKARLILDLPFSVPQLHT